MPSLREAHLRHAVHYKLVLHTVDEHYLRGAESLQIGLAAYDLEWSNIQAGQAWVAAQAEADDEIAQLCSAYADVGSYLLNLRQHPRERIHWLEAALTCTRRLKRRGIEGVHLGNLGLAYTDLGETYHAIECYEQTLAIAREVGDRRMEGNSLGNLGTAYSILGDLHTAIENYQKALVIDRAIGDRHGAATDLGNLGVAYKNLGEPERAIELYRQALVLQR